MSLDAPVMTELMMVEFHRALPLGRRVVKDCTKVICSFLVGFVDSLLPHLAHMAMDCAVGVVV